MAFSGSQTTGLQSFGAPGRTRSFTAKTVIVVPVLVFFTTEAFATPTFTGATFTAPAFDTETYTVPVFDTETWND